MGSITVAKKIQIDEKPHECDICRHRHPFEMPDEIMTAARTGNLVVFAGAGVSTESSLVFPFSLYDQVAQEMDLPESSSLAFSSLMSAYCSRPNGRRKLLTLIKSRLDNIESFPQLLRAATSFHCELATVPHLTTIVTTNWDDYFERFCGATPVVTEKDFVFWDLPGRKVFKIHGSVSNYGSIVATDQDYAACYRRLRSKLVGANLKMMLATKTVLFVGYSLRDQDFNRVYALLQHDMGELLPQAFILTLENESVD